VTRSAEGLNPKKNKEKKKTKKKQKKKKKKKKKKKIKKRKGREPLSEQNSLFDALVSIKGSASERAGH